MKKNINFSTTLSEDTVIDTGLLFDKLEIYMKSDSHNYDVKKEKALNKKLNEFLKIFTIEKINEMTIDQYCTGHGKESKKSFCNWIENTLDFGSISGQTTAYQKFVIYYDKKTKKYSFGDKRTKHRKGFGSTEFEIYENVKKHLRLAISDIKNKNYAAFSENPLNPMFKNKVAFIYDSNNEIPIYSDNDLSNILILLGLPFNIKADRVYKRALLFNFYEISGIAELISPFIFMSFIYNSLGYRDSLRNELKDTKIDEYSLLDVAFKSLPKKNKTIAHKKAMIFKQSSTETKRIVGKNGEKIVHDFLISKSLEMGITKLTSWCEKDDSKGYDFSYIDSNGQYIMIEVKATKQDYKNMVSFEMSSNELSVMKENLDSYYIYYINNIYKEKVIQRIKASEIKGEEPSHYKVYFESSKIQLIEKN